MAEAEKAAGRVASVMQEHRTFPPPEAFSSKARIGSLEAYRELYDRAAADPAAFWAERAESLPWLKPYDEVLRWIKGHRCLEPADYGPPPVRRADFAGHVPGGELYTAL